MPRAHTTIKKMRLMILWPLLVTIAVIASAKLKHTLPSSMFDPNHGEKVSERVGKTSCWAVPIVIHAKARSV
jgi:hypothetical protein